MKRLKCIRHLLALLLIVLFVGCGSNVTPPSWGTAKLIETENGGDAIVPQLAKDAAGNAVAVWFQSDGTHYSIWANTYSATTGTWGTATRISSSTAVESQFPQISMNSTGNAMVVWHQYDSGIYSNLWSCRYSMSTGAWSTPELVESNNTEHANIPRVAIDEFGNALAIWYQSDSTNPPSIWSNRFSSSTNTWGIPTLIETDDAGYAVDPRIAMDSSGNAIAVWFQSDGTRYNIWSNRYSSASDSWGAATLIELDDAGDAQYPQIAIDNSGNSMVIWFQFDGTRTNIYSNRYTASTGTWGEATLVENNSGDAGYPQIAFDTSGNAIAIWHQFDGTHTSIWSNRYIVSINSWGTPTLVETDNSGDAALPQIAIDRSGNAVAVWSQYDGTFNNIYFNRFSYSKGTWGTTTLLETTSFGPAYLPQIAIDRSGNTLVVWNQYDGPYFSIWSNVYR